MSETLEHGYYLEDLAVGMAAETVHLVTESDVEGFATLTGDTNPIHMDEDFASKTMFKTRIAHGAFIASLCSAVMGTQLPGPGAIFRTLNLNYRGPVRIGEEVTARVEITELDEAKQMVKLAITCIVRGRRVVRGDAGAWVARRADVENAA